MPFVRGSYALSQNYFTTAQRARRYQESLRDEKIINDLYSDNLSDVPDDIFSESDAVSGSECGSGSEGSDSDDTMWVKVDKTPILGQFTGNPGVKQIPSHQTEVSETVICFLEIRWKRQKQSQTQTWCDRDCQLQLHVCLVWTPMGDFWVICRNMSSQKLCRVNIARIRILLGNSVFVQFTKERDTVHLQVLPSATPQRGMFQEIPHSQALLKALVSVS
jgi:hypothetical protein